VSVYLRVIVVHFASYTLFSVLMVYLLFYILYSSVIVVWSKLWL